ncbi:MAG: hypothetical protein IJG41_03520 [Bacteroidales bacterium]|nr:hypothetical protein [Bacteroidales bacterium]
MVMTSKYDTCFFERYAMYSLEALLGERYAHLVNADRPDLQDEEQGIGIEVTRAITEDKNVANSLINEMAGRTVKEVDEDLLKIQESGYSYGLDLNYSVGSNEYNYWALALPMKRILESKLWKVNNGFYGDFKEFGLYVFTKYDLVADEVNEIIGFMMDAQQSCQIRYEHLFISQIETLFDCDLRHGDFDCFPIDSRLRRKFYYKAIK